MAFVNSALIPRPGGRRGCAAPARQARRADARQPEEVGGQGAIAASAYCADAALCAYRRNTADALLRPTRVAL